jgi:serine/threonine-protein phosphatase 2B catalytic subunit
MPLAAVVGNEYFCVHGGISPDIDTINDVHKITRYIDDPGENGPFCDLLWSDPAKNQRAFKVTYANNNTRGCSFKFGLKPVAKFLERNCIKSIIRGHEVQEDGY